MASPGVTGSCSVWRLVWSAGVKAASVMCRQGWAFGSLSCSTWSVQHHGQRQGVDVSSLLRLGHGNRYALALLRIPMAKAVTEHAPFRRREHKPLSLSVGVSKNVEPSLILYTTIILPTTVITFFICLTLGPQDHCLRPNSP